MTRIKNIVAVVLAVLMLSALAFASAAGAKEKDKGLTSFTLVARHDGTAGFFDWGSTWTAELETIEGVSVGWAGGRCMELPNFGRTMCDLVIRLAEGDITATAAENDDSILYAVTGGTSAFVTVQGEIEDVLVSELPLLTSMTFHLTGASVDY